MRRNLLAVAVFVLSAHFARAETCWVHWDPGDLTDDQALLALPGGPLADVSAIQINAGERGVFTAASDVQDETTQARATSNRLVDVADGSMIYRIDLYAHVPDGADPNTAATVSSEPNDFNLTITYRNAGPMAPPTADITLTLSVVLYPRGGTGALQASVFDLNCDDLNGPPVMLNRQETFTVAKGEQVPLGSFIENLAYDIFLTGAGTVSGTAVLSYTAHGDCDGSAGGGGGSGNGREDNSELGPPSDGCDVPTNCDDDDDSDSDDDGADHDPGDESPDPDCDPCCRGTSGAARPTHAGTNFSMTLESGRFWTDLPIVQMWAAGKPRFDLKMVWREHANRLFLTNYHYYLWARCEADVNSPPEDVFIYSPVDHRYWSEGTYAATWTFRWNHQTQTYEAPKPMGLTLSFEWDPNANERVFRLSYLSGSTMTFRGQPCPPDAEGTTARARLTEIQDRRLRITRITWNAHHLIDSITDPWGRTIQLQVNDAEYAAYTQVNHPAIDADDGRTTFEITTNAVGLEHHTVTDPTGARARYRFNAQLPYFSVASEQKKNGNVFSAHRLGPTALVLRAYPDADPNNFFDPATWGEPEQISRAEAPYTWGFTRECTLLGPCKLWQHHGYVSLEDGEGRVTNYYRDRRGMLTEVNIPDLSSLNIRTWWMDYDPQHFRPTRILDGLDSLWQYRWNANGRMIRKTPPGVDPNSPDGSWAYEYHPEFANKATRKIKPNGEDSIFAYYDPNDVYNRQGLLSSKTDPNDGVTTYDYRYYDAEAAPGSVELPLPGRIMWKERLEPDGVLTRWEYSPEGYTTSIVMSKGATELSRVEFSDYTPLGLPQTRVDHRDINDVVVSTFEYDNLGRLLKRTVDPADLALEWQYQWDGEGYLTQTIDPEGLVRRFDYDHRNRLTEVEVDGGSPELVRTVVFEYDRSDRLRKIVDPKQQETTLHYDAYRGRLTKVVDREGHETEYTYHSYTGRSLKGGRDLVHTITRTIDQPPTSEKHTVAYHYDDLNRPMMRIVDPDGDAHWSTWEYNEDGGCGCDRGTPGTSLVHRVQDSTGAVAYLHYDKLDRLSKLVRKVGDTADNGGDSNDAITTIEYDAIGLVKEIVDPDGVRLTREYDWANRRVTQRLDQTGFDLTSVFDFDMVGNLIGVTNPAGNVYTLIYDLGGRLTSVIDGAQAVSATYDKVGRMLTWTKGETWSVERNGLGQVIKFFDPVVESPTDKFTAYLYDLNGNRTSRIDNEGRETVFEYDALDRLFKVTEDVGGIGAETEVAYNGLNRIKTLCDTVCNETEYLYDRLGRLTHIEFPDAGQISLDYSDWVDHRRITRTDQRNFATSYTFNELYRLSERAYDNGDPKDMFFWTKAGRLSEANRGPSAASLNQSMSFEWDSAGRIDAAVQDFVNAPSLPTFSFAAVNLVDPGAGIDQRAISYPNPLNGTATGRSVTHAWDDRGRLANIADSALGPVWSGTYTSRDQLQLETIGDDLFQQGYAYDANGRLVWHVAYVPTGDPWHMQRNIGHDAVGNRTYRRELIWGGSNTSELYAYDGLDRLTSFQRGELNGAGDAIVADPPADALKSQTWTDLDNNGNWLESEWEIQRDGSVDAASDDRVVNSVNEVDTRYLTDPNSVVTQIGLSYDPAGNLIGDEEFTYHYDALNRLEAVVTAGLTEILRVEYDALGRVVTRTHRLEGGATQTIHYVYDVPTPGGPNAYAVAQEYDGDPGAPGLLREFIHRAGHLRPVAMIDYTDLGAVAAGTAETFWYLYDERGSVVAITDDAGMLVEEYRYDPYGGATVYDGTGIVLASWLDSTSWDDAALTPSAIGNPYGFTGHRFSVAGLYETPFRAYSPALGRWLQRDPLGYVDGVNLYQYVLGNPMRWYDPFGLDVRTWDRPGGLDASNQSPPRDSFDTFVAVGSAPGRGVRSAVADTASGIAHAVVDPAGTAGAIAQSVSDSYKTFAADGNGVVGSGIMVAANALLGAAYNAVEDIDDGYTIDGEVADSAEALGNAGGRILGDTILGHGLGKLVPGRGGSPSCSVKGGATPGGPLKGGTYKLIDPETGDVARTGQTKHLDVRRDQHKHGEATKGLEFEIDRYSDDLEARLGREQIIHDMFRPRLNFRQPIGPLNPNRQRYLDKGKKLE